MSEQNYQPETLAVRAGAVQSQFGENSEALFLTSSFTFESAAQAAARFIGEEPGNIYSRFTNPTVSMFEERLAALEGAEQCVATASGMSAILACVMGLLKSGDHIVASRSIFGATINLFNNVIKKFGVETTYVSATDVSEWRAAVRPNTRLSNCPPCRRWTTSFAPCRIRTSTWPASSIRSRPPGRPSRTISTRS